MEQLHQKVSYLEGLAEGLEIKSSSKEGKLLLSIIDVLNDFAYAMDDVIKNQEELEEYISCINEDLADVEEEVFDFLDDDYLYEDLDDDCCECIEIECSEHGDSMNERDDFKNK